MKLGLIEVERINRVTLKRVALLDELRERERRGRSPKVGRWRHEYNLELLRAKIYLLETKRSLMALGRSN